MNWKLKAFIQNCVAYLPGGLSYDIYFKMQRCFGGLKKPFSPLGHFSAGISILKKIKLYGNDILNKIFFEVGTGRAPLLPVAFWLAGAGKTITVDLNPYMHDELIADMLFCIREKPEEIKKLFGSLIQKDRFEQLLAYSTLKKTDQEQFLSICQIDYMAPCDASKTHLKDNSINYHISHTVYEHIPLPIIKDILYEGNRIITRDGIFINHIDYGDHFSYMDNHISVINFLQYSDAAWEKYAGNRYMYMNRARHDEFIELFKAVGHEFIEIEPYKNKKAEEILEQGGIRIDKRFNGRSKEVLAITGASFMTKKKG